MIDNVLFNDNIHDNAVNTIIIISVCEEKDCKWQWWAFKENKE